MLLIGKKTFQLWSLIWLLIKWKKNVLWKEKAKSMIVLSGLWVKYWVGFQQGWRERKNNWFVNFCDGQLPDITVKTPPTVRHLFRQFAVLKRRIKVSASCHFYKFWLCRVVECVQLWCIEVVSDHEVEKIKK